jgi:hypothetical protein
VSRDVKPKGITVTLERVGPMYAMPIQRANPPPDPPLAPGVGGEMEPNPSDPDYHKALEDYEARLRSLLNDALLDAAIGDDLEVDTAAVARLRAKAAKYGATLEADDRLAYIKYCLIPHTDDMELFFTALSEYDTVREEDIRAAGAMFRGDGTGNSDRPGDAVAAEKQDPV